MTAEIISIDPESTDSPEITRAAKALADGALVAFPTETVYGLAANAANENAVERLRAAKGRDATQPFTVHIGRSDDAASFVPSVSNMGRRLMRKAWPGPLTLVFKVADPSKVPVRPRLSEAGADAIYSRGSAGIRFPDHRASEAFLSQSGVPVIASSANRTGAPAPVSAREIGADLAGDIDLILDAGATRYRKGSTIVELNGEGYRLLREGVWDERTIRRFSTVNILFVCTGNTCRSPIAAGLAKKFLAARLGCDVADLQNRGVNVISAGTSAHGGGLVSPESVSVCRRRGIDISGHYSQPVTPDLVASADFIFGMTRQHVDMVKSISPRAANKTLPLSADGDIADPLGGPIEAYETAAEVIERALEQRLSEVTV